MLNPKIFVMSIAGAISGALAAGFYTDENPLMIGALFGAPGAIFAICIIIGIYIAHDDKKRHWGIPLFLIISTAGYAASVWGLLFIHEEIHNLISFFIAGLVGGGIMLMGLKIFISIKWSDILSLSILAGILAWMSMKIDGYFSPNRAYDFLDLETSGLFILHILWNTVMATAIAFLTFKKTKIQAPIEQNQL